MAAASRDSSQHATDASTTVGASQAPIVRRCFYAACDRCSADVVERAEEHHQLSHVSLLGALHGERYGFPEASITECFQDERYLLQSEIAVRRNAAIAAQDYVTH